MPKIKIKKEEIYMDFRDIERKLDEEDVKLNQEMKREFLEVISRRLEEICPSYGGKLIYVPISSNHLSPNFIP